MVVKSVKVKSENQKGGITVGVMNIQDVDKNRKKNIYYWAAVAAIIMLILGVFTYFGLTGDKMFGKNNQPKESYDVKSYNQFSGVTDGKIENLTVVNPTVSIPEPEFEIKSLIVNEPKNGQFMSEFMLSIISVVPIPNLYLEVKVPTIVSMDTIAQRGGTDMEGNSGVREGFAFTNLIYAYGEYRITVITKEKESFKNESFNFS